MPFRAGREGLQEIPDTCRRLTPGSGHHSGWSALVLSDDLFCAAPARVQEKKKRGRLLIPRLQLGSAGPGPAREITGRGVENREAASGTGPPATNQYLRELMTFCADSLVKVCDLMSYCFLIFLPAR